MLDIFGNVFGRSKKEKSLQSPAGQPGDGSEGFAVVGQDASGQNAFIYPTMLTNEVSIGHLVCCVIT